MRSTAPDVGFVSSKTTSSNRAVLPLVDVRLGGTFAGGVAFLLAANGLEVTNRSAWLYSQRRLDGV